MNKRLMNTFAFHESQEFYDYRKRLDEHIKKLSAPKTKIYKVGEKGIIEATRQNILKNPYGELKWNGWETIGENFIIIAYNDGCIVESGNFENKETANKYFLDVKKRLEMIQNELYFKFE